MHLIADGREDIETVLVLRVLAEGLEHTNRPGHLQAPVVFLHQRLEDRPHDKRLTGFIGEPGLSLVHGCRVHLRSRLSVHKKEPQGEHCDEEGLAVLPRHLDIRLTVFPPAGGPPFQAEHIRRYEQLPVLQDERLPGERTLVVRELTCEVVEVRQGLPIHHQIRIGHVVPITLAGQYDRPAGKQPAGDHVINIPVDPRLKHLSFPP